MKLYTHHSSTIPIYNPVFVINPTLGDNWKDVPGYPAALTKLQGIVGTDQILWCESKPRFVRMTPSVDLVRWELEVAFGDILRQCRDRVWEDIIYERSADWSQLFVELTESQLAQSDDVTVLVRHPVQNPRRIEMLPRYPDRR